jgi:hypothetical protein
MPEQISKYPEVTLQVLKGVGARCGEGATPRILTRCPPDKFCSLSSGEICVYGVKDIPQMTQISSQELARVVCPTGQQTSVPFAASLELALPLVTLALGLMVGRWWRQRVERR